MRKLLLAAVLVLMASGAQAATLNVVNGQLMGASNVLVDGSLYDVQFLDGSCMGLYNGCDDVSDFTFQTEASANLASQALLDQVFLDGPSGDFDSLPALTNGCSSTDDCRVFTPYYPLNLFQFLGVAAINNFADVVQGGFEPDNGQNWVISPRSVFAVWDTAAIPEPSTALLLGLGLTGLAAKGRRRS